MVAKWTNKTPSWFKKSNYNFTSKLTLLGWLRMLGVRRKLRSDMLVTGMVAGNLEEVISAHLSRSRPNAEANDLECPLYRDVDATIPWPSLVEFEITDEIEHESEDLSYLSGEPALVINPRAPDQILIRDFENWVRSDLKIIRKIRGIPTPGPIPLGPRKAAPSLRKMFTPRQIKPWRTHSVLAVLDLDLIAKARGEPRLTNAAIGELLPHRSVDEPEKWGQRARKTAGRALDMLNTLATKVGGDTT